jgi:hypothetical protein
VLTAAAPLKPDEEAQLVPVALRLEATLGLPQEHAEREARRAVLFIRDFGYHRDLMNTAPSELLVGILADFALEGPAPKTQPGRGLLLLTLHYGPLSLLWLWLAWRAAAGELPPFSLFYDTTRYKPDLPPGQYGRLCEAGVIEPSRCRMIDVRFRGVNGALAEARRDLGSRRSLLFFPDARFARAGEDGVIPCRVGALDVALPAGAALLARATGCDVQGVVLRPDADGHAVVWTAARPADGVAEVVQDLLDATVARDPAPWQSWFLAEGPIGDW